MAIRKSDEPGQLMLFVADQVANADGSFTVRPRAISIASEIGAKRASKILKLHVQTIYRLCELGEAAGGLKAWQLPSERGNAKWRIDWESVAGYKARREAAKLA
jgi:hypothetical protein